MEPNLVDFGGSPDQQESTIPGGELSPTEANSAKMDNDVELLDDAVRRLRPRSVRSLDRKSSDSLKSQMMSFSLPPTDTDQSELASTMTAPVKSLPKALQPKEGRRGPEPVVATHSGVGTHNQLSSRVNVSDSVIRQQRRSSALGSPISPSAKSPSTSPLSPKPEAVSRRPETEIGSSVGGRSAAYEPSSGLVKLRNIQREQIATETRTPYRPEVKTLPYSRHKSMSFSDLLAMFESPSITTATSKPKPTTPSKYSVLNKFTFDVAEPRSTAEPIASSVSISSSSYDPSPTISRLMKLQQTDTAVRSGQKRFDTQASTPEPISATQIRNSVSPTSPTAKEENSDAVSSVSAMSDPIELSIHSVDSSSSYGPASPDIEFQEESTEVDQGGSNPSAFSPAAVIKESTYKATDDDDDAKVIVGSDDEDTPPPLPSVSPPDIQLPLPLDLDEERPDHDDDGYVCAFLT